MKSHGHPIVLQGIIEVSTYHSRKGTLNFGKGVLIRFAARGDCPPSQRGHPLAFLRRPYVGLFPLLDVDS